MENKIVENYCYDSTKPLTYEELKELGIGVTVWCEYSQDWVCVVEDEIKTIVKDLEFPNEIDLMGSFCCIGDLKNTMNRNKMTVKVYELRKEL